jgi:FMN phosphatase YigB (HAD superfamily)
MIRALLVDLDGTLLDNDVERFIAAYFDLLAGDLLRFGAKDQILRAIMQGTKAMLDNDDPQRTLAEIFYEVFGGATGAAGSDVAPVVAAFYEKTYPQLAPLTRPKDGAGQLLQAAQSKGLDVAIATNPLMVRRAIEQRLAWANVPVDKFEYSLITDVETFHFAKPRLSYFGEALARLGLLPGEAAMVGNDPKDDLAPAAALGIPVFQITETPPEATAGGGLPDAARWLQTDPAGDPHAPNRPDSLLARLKDSWPRHIYDASCDEACALQAG